jgi:predicted NUDIX family phosphoesterase
VRWTPVFTDHIERTLQATLQPASVDSPWMTERVFVLPRESVPGGCEFSGVRQADDLAALRQAVQLHGRYLPRPAAEENPAFKQLVPYVVVHDGASVFLMERTDAGGDARLHGKASIGVGGHLNPVDEGADPLLAGLRREWIEELVADWEPEFNLVGLLNDDSNPVGAVHLGVVFTVAADGRGVEVRERDKLRGRFVPTAEVFAAWDRLETWSQLVAAALLRGAPPMRR